MTIHQPSTQLFEHLDDLLLLTSGKTAYFGSTANASTYFESLGLDVPDNINPADFYLDCISEKPQDVLPFQQNHQLEVYKNVSHWYELYSDRFNRPLSTHINEYDKNNTVSFGYDNTAVMHNNRPNEYTRIIRLLQFLIHYYNTEKSLYLLRLVSMVILALFTGSLYFQLSRTYTEVPTIAGFVFFSTWSILFASISGIVIHSRDRYTIENEYLNGGYKLSTIWLSIFISSIPYHVVIGFIYNAILWYMVGVNNNGIAYLYASLSTTILSLMMESVAWLIVTLLKDPMLSTTFSMVMLGCFYLFAGFFVKQTNMVRSVFWACYIVPTRYSLNGQIDNIFNSQSYSYSNNGQSSGSTVVTQFFDLQNGLDTSAWGNLGIVIAFTIGFRILHWGLQVIIYSKYSR